MFDFFNFFRENGPGWTALVALVLFGLYLALELQERKQTFLDTNKELEQTLLTIQKDLEQALEMEVDRLEELLAEIRRERETIAATFEGRLIAMEAREDKREAEAARLDDKQTRRIERIENMMLHRGPQFFSDPQAP